LTGYCRDIIEAGRRLYLRGLVAGREGNISVRLPQGHILITPRGLSKGFLQEGDLVIIDTEGRVVSGDREPSSEWRMHVAAYRYRPDVGAVVHAHPPLATAFSVARGKLPLEGLPEVLLVMGPVASVPYAPPGTEELAQKLLPFWKGHDAFLLCNHGALTLGKDLEEALYRMEVLEQCASIMFYASLLQRICLLEEREKLKGGGDEGCASP